MSCPGFGDMGRSRNSPSVPDADGSSSSSVALALGWCSMSWTSNSDRSPAEGGILRRRRNRVRHRYRAARLFGAAGSLIFDEVRVSLTPMWGNRLRQEQWQLEHVHLTQPPDRECGKSAGMARVPNVHVIV